MSNSSSMPATRWTQRAAGALALLGTMAGASAACPTCEHRAEVWNRVFDAQFANTFMQVLLAVPLLVGIALAFRFVDYRFVSKGAASARSPGPGAFLSAGVMLGIGLGGFLDGIVLHMLLQWHHLIAVRVPPIDLVSVEVNMFWDGIFKLAMWMITLLGIFLFWRAHRTAPTTWSAIQLSGALLLGWGIFNVADSVLFHWILRLHHVKMDVDNWLFWDLAFFASGVLLIVLGWWLAGRRPAVT